MKKEPSELPIEKYLNGKSTVEEEESILQWYDSFEDDEDPIDGLTLKEQLELKERMLSKVKSTIHSSDSFSVYPNIRPLKKRAFAIAGAAAVLLIGFSFLFYLVWSNGLPSNRISVYNSGTTILKQTLPDGSQLWLSPNAAIDYSPTFTENRKVNMSGEIFFDVHRDEEHPFVIYSGPLITQVLGTSFRIKSYRDGSAEVSVITGRVSVKAPTLGTGGEELILLPNQKATYLANLGLLEKSKEIESSTVKMWEKADFSFVDVPVKEIIEALNKEFNVRIKLTNPRLLNYTLKADFNHQNLISILEVLEKSLNLDYEIKGDEIVLWSKKDSIR